MQFVDQSAWNGIVLYRLSGDPSTGNGPLISMSGDAAIMGTVQLFLDIDGTIGKGHKQLVLGDNSQILFSSELVGNALGDHAVTEIIEGDASSYRIE